LDSPRAENRGVVNNDGGSIDQLGLKAAAVRDRHAFTKAMQKQVAQEYRLHFAATSALRAAVPFPMDGHSENEIDQFQSILSAPRSPNSFGQEPSTKTKKNPLSLRQSQRLAVSSLNSSNRKRTT
jgi:hypothetical protein